MATRGGKREGAGRKKGYAAFQAEKSREIVCQLLEKSWAPIIKKAIKQAKSGDAEARKFLRDSGYGKPKETSDVNITAFSLLDLGKGADDSDDESDDK